MVKIQFRNSFKIFIHLKITQIACGATLINKRYLITGTFTIFTVIHL